MRKPTLFRSFRRTRSVKFLGPPSLVVFAVIGVFVEHQAGAAPETSVKVVKAGQKLRVTVLFPKASRLEVCVAAPVACESNQPALELLLLRNGPTWRLVQSFSEREEMFKWPYHLLPPLFRNLTLEEHPNFVDPRYSMFTFLFSKSDSVNLLEHFCLYREGKTGHLGN